LFNLQTTQEAAMAQATLTDPRHYLDEIRANTEKMRSQGKVTPTENALFGMIDGMAGLMTFTLEQLADMRRRLEELESR
jgi:hypothetical protein